VEEVEGLIWDMDLCKCPRSMRVWSRRVGGKGPGRRRYVVLWVTKSFSGGQKVFRLVLALCWHFHSMQAGAKKRRETEGGSMGVQPGCSVDVVPCLITFILNFLTNV
jgi:hypothetical protein